VLITTTVLLQLSESCCQTHDRKLPQMLEEVCKACGPFRAILKKISSALVHAIYSSYFISEAGSLQFNQTPYFVVVERLEEEKAFLLKEKDDFRDLLLRREVSSPSNSTARHGTWCTSRSRECNKRSEV
jgi:hypothetical protein